MHHNVVFITSRFFSHHWDYRISSPWWTRTGGISSSKNFYPKILLFRSRCAGEWSLHWDQQRFCEVFNQTVALLARRERLPVPVIMYETCRNFLSDPAADNKNARKKRPGEAPFALTPIKNRIFVIAPSKSCLFLKQPKYGFSGLRVSEWYTGSIMKHYCC